ncbi:MAG TPA: hypothetical protein VHY19_14925 [Steroidobacteraceae bacterium]|jgi:hypothetical protein|nr:hypothetical protein [Steroidobacteraceae bacterium]
MEISSDQALDALQQVHDAQRRISIQMGYGRGAPHFLLWGVIWIVGFTLSYLYPAEATRLWLVLDVAGFVGSVLLARHYRAHCEASSSAIMWRMVALVLTAVGFVIASYAIFLPHEAAQFAVFPALLFAAIYIGLGLWRGMRWVVAGLVLAALALVGYFLLTQYLMLWMAAVGGGTLLTTGFWLRRG